jgi:hypothetical protein
VRVAEVDLHLARHRERLVGGHLVATIPRQRSSKLSGQLFDLARERFDDIIARLAADLDQ